MTLCKVEMSFSWWVHVLFQGCMIQWSLHWVKIPLTRIPCSQTCFETKDHDSSWRTQTYFLWQHTNNIRRILQLVGGFNFSLFPTIEMWWWSGFSDRTTHLWNWPGIYRISRGTTARTVVTDVCCASSGRAPVSEFETVRNRQRMGYNVWHN